MGVHQANYTRNRRDTFKVKDIGKFIIKPITLVRIESKKDLFFHPLYILLNQ